jgi:polysaccharide export outer membrane protein
MKLNGSASSNVETAMKPLPSLRFVSFDRMNIDFYETKGNFNFPDKSIDCACSFARIEAMKPFWKVTRRGLFACTLLFAGAIFTGCRSSSDVPIFSDMPDLPSATGAPVSAGLPADVARFHVGDTVIVTITGPPTPIEPHQEPIKEDGTITMPDIGKVPAAGKTAGELQNEIHDLYVPALYHHLTVTVNIGDRVYYVRGEVKAPGRQLYLGQTTVTKAITSAGDFTDFANHKKVWLIRANGQRIKVNVDKVLQGKTEDPQVYPNDQVEVLRRIF